jgi:hypothetical protein
VLEALAGGAVVRPILLVLLKLLQAVTIWQIFRLLNQRWLSRLFASYQAI